MFCIKCGKVLSDDVQTCNYCNASLEEILSNDNVKFIRTCKHCQTPNTAESLYCIICGNKFDNQKSNTENLHKSSMINNNRQYSHDESSREIVNSIIEKGLQGNDYKALKQISHGLKVFGIVLIIFEFILAYIIIEKAIPYIETMQRLLLTFVIGAILGNITYLIYFAIANLIDMMLAIEKNTRKSSAYLEAAVHILGKNENKQA